MKLGKERALDRVAKAMTPHLEPGEVIAVRSVTRTGPAFLNNPLGAYFAGVLALLLLTRDYMLVVTDRRLVLIGLSPFGRAKRVALSVPRDDVSIVSSKTSSLAASVTLRVGGDQERTLRFRQPWLDTALTLGTTFRQAT